MSLPPQFALRRCLPKTERLHHRKYIQELFRESSSLFVHPFKLVYNLYPAPTTEAPQVLFTVPKKTFRRATQRNRLRRQVREAYRLHKHTLQATLPPARALRLAIIYVGKTALPYASLEKRLVSVLQRLAVAIGPSDH